MSSTPDNYNNPQEEYGKEVPPQDSALNNLDGVVSEVAIELILSANDPEAEAKRILYGVEQEYSVSREKKLK